jgi:hypothetical protein
VTAKLQLAALVCEIEDTRKQRAPRPFLRFAKLYRLNRGACRTVMKRKTPHPHFDRTLQSLREHGFDVTPSAHTVGGMLVGKHGVGAVLVAPAPKKGADDRAAVLAIPPGVLVKGEVGRLVDRGYQKFIRSSQYELPASASQLQAIHAFSEELKQLTGATSLYNESLGTTSDFYHYDRLMGREAGESESVAPWEPANGH